MSAPAVESREIVLGGLRVADTLRRSVRKTLGLRIDSRGLTVGVPLRGGLREIEAFIRSHAEWVIDKLKSRPAAEAQAAFDISDGAAIPLLGDAWHLRLASGNNRGLWHEGGPQRVVGLALRGGGGPTLRVGPARGQPSWRASG